MDGVGPHPGSTMARTNSRPILIAGILMMISAGMAGYIAFPTTAPVAHVVEDSSDPAALPTPPFIIEPVGGPGYEPPEATNLPAELEEIIAEIAATPPTNGDEPKPSHGNGALNAEVAPANAAVPPSDDDSAVSARGDAIHDAMRAAAPRLRECYDLVLDLEPELSDRLVFELLVTDIGADAPLTEVLTIESGQMQINHLQCFSEVMREMRMPPPTESEESYRVRYPVVLLSVD